MPISLTCAVCNRVFLVPPSRKDRIKTCSIKCGGIYRRKISNAKCKTCSKEFTFQTCRGDVKYCSKKCYGLGNRGENNYNWGGDTASYRTQHKWIEVRLGKAKSCAFCGRKRKPKGKKRYFQWANISKVYKRDVTDYFSLCLPCHKAFDKKSTS